MEESLCPTLKERWAPFKGWRSITSGNYSLAPLNHTTLTIATEPMYMGPVLLLPAPPLFLGHPAAITCFWEGNSILEFPP